MHLVLLGLNHKTASVAIRERLYFSEQILNKAYETLMSFASVKGCVILSTCNRIEIYMASPNIEACFVDAQDFIEQFHGVNRDYYLPVMYRKHCEEAVSHLYKVAASLDSMVVGEYQIQGQIRDAYTFASEHAYANNLIHKIFQSAIQVGKAVRSETEIGKGAVSIASVAVDLVHELMNNRPSFTLLIVGAGKMANLAVQNLSQSGKCKVLVCNRTDEKALELSQKFDASVVAYENRIDAVCASDVIIVSTSADEYIIDKEQLQEAYLALKNKTHYFIDLSIPRNIDPSIYELDSVVLYSIDDLQNVISSNIEKRSSEIERAEQIIATIAKDYYEWYAKQEIMPVMQHIKHELEVIKSRTIDANKSALSDFNEQQQKAVITILDNYSEKLIKAIMKNMTNVAGNEELRRMAQSLKNSLSVDEE